MASGMKALTQAAASVPSDLDKARRSLLLGLGGLWLLDGLLQMQPYMFTVNLIAQVLRPVAAGQPWWLARLIDWSIALVTPHLPMFNWAIIVLQITIGLLLWSGRRSLVTAGLWLSIAWGLAVWVFGEGIGGLLTGSSTFLSGAPGSVLLYVVAAALLLLPEDRWYLGPAKRFDVATLAVGLNLYSAALLELRPMFWTKSGLAGVLGPELAAPQPTWLRTSLTTAISALRVDPALLNGILVALFLGCATLLLLRAERSWSVWSAFALLAFTWWLGQDVGMLFSGQATDPNSAPVLALLLYAGWASRNAGQGSHSSA